MGGELTDRLGRKVVIVGTQLVRAASFLGLGAAVLVHAPVVWFGLLTSLSAFSGRAFEPPSGAMVADIATGSARAEYYAVLRIGGNLGWAIGPAIGGFLAALSYPTLFVIAALVLLAAGLFMAFKVEETRPHRLLHSLEPQGSTTLLPGSTGTAPLARFGFEELGQALRDGTFVRYCVISLVLFTVMSQLISTLSVYSVAWAGITKLQLGALYTLNGLMVVFLQFPVVRALASYRMTTALILGICAILLGIIFQGQNIAYMVGLTFSIAASANFPALVMAIGHDFALLALAMFVVTMGEIVTTPASMALVSNFSTAELRGRYMGVYGLFNSFGWSIGPLIGGVLLDLASKRAMLLWGPVGSLAILAAAGFWDLRRRVDRTMDRNLEGAAAETATA